MIQPPTPPPRQQTTSSVARLAVATLLLATLLVAALIAVPVSARQETAPSAIAEPGPRQTDPSSGPDGLALYEQHCASCHDPADGGSKAPSRRALARLNVAHLVFSMANGSMKVQASQLDFGQQIAIALALAEEAPEYRTPDVARCRGGGTSADSTEAGPLIELSERVSRWGLDERGTAATPAGTSELRAANVASLELAWAFGLPGAVDARSQPVITEDTLFVAATTGHLFALDRRTGCTRWHVRTVAPPRTALALAWPSHAPGGNGDRDGRRAVLLYGDIQAHVNAVDALTGELVWRTEARVAEHSLLTGAPVAHGGRVIVPVSLSEVPLARDPAYECCRSHGAVMALDLASGAVQWTTELTEDAAPHGETSAGTRIWGPSGVPVWSTPTIDAERGLVYVGTGQNASPPATELSDSVVALDLETGKIAWHWQALAGDVYNDACSAFPPGPNCPQGAGPDFDIGASVILHRGSDGRQRLLVGQKSGDVYALDPAKEGELLWHRRVGSGSVLGGVHWGMAVRGDVLVAPVADPPFPAPGYRPRPGVVALDATTGEVRWRHAAERGCESYLASYFSREQLYPECSFYFGFSAAPTIVDDLVLAARLDGRVVALSLEEGRVLWEDETIRAFDTVNGVEAHGGSIDAAGPLAVGRMVYLQSGYSLFGQLPGNVLLAYRLPDHAAD